jgi:serine/tyrosine/threonine adenylyltransferase
MPAPLFDTTYAQLPERFFTCLTPLPVKAPRLLKLNHALADELALDSAWLASGDGRAMLSGNRFPETAASIATVYAGHQFGGFTPQLGDGRALLIGEIIDAAGKRRDIQLKGAGPTPYSRNGDGRAGLGPVLREYIISEAMHALGVPSTRALAAVITGEHIWRETPQPGAVLTRVAASHIRVGTFQFFAARGDTDALRLLADHVIDRHYPQARSAENPVAALLNGVIARQAELIAQWMNLGFVHGVMNTDNMTVSGETIDYGPCAFMDAYDPETVFSSIDATHRYAYGNQPRIAQWNLARFAETLLPLLSDNVDAAVELANTAIGSFPSLFAAAMTTGLRAKLGLLTQEADDLSLAQDLLGLMAESRADYTLVFRTFTKLELSPEAADSVHALFALNSGYDSAKLNQWLTRWNERLFREPQHAHLRQATMRQANPVYIPRNHLVEAALKAAVEEQNFGPFEEIVSVLSKPCVEQTGREIYALPPAVVNPDYRTFCGT